MCENPGEQGVFAQGVNVRKGVNVNEEFSLPEENRWRTGIRTCKSVAQVDRGEESKLKSRIKCLQS
jgi:hypothetical protein